MTRNRAGRGRQAQRRRRGRRLTAIDLFAGAGGLTLGLRWAGFHVIAAVENNPLAVATYTRHNKQTVVWHDDIRNVYVTEVRRRLRLKAGRLDVLAGCPPCQGFSAMRTLNGRRRIHDREQKDLLFEFLRFVRGLRPKTVMMENVPRLAEDRRISRFSAELKNLGYQCRYRVLNAAHYGVPQRRRRIILLASRHGMIPFAKGDKSRIVTVRETIRDLPRPGNSGDPMHDVTESRSKKVADLIRLIPKNGGGRLNLPRTKQLACHKRLKGFWDVYGRMSWDAVSPTITSGFVNPSKGRFLHPTQNRTITPREAALLQTFPRYYKFPLDRGKFPAARLIGNALPPKLIKRIALPIARQIHSRAVSNDSATGSSTHGDKRG
jgi:DNA (cytosine-5)-methyltransferase 1